jgi:small subunit ribosomal protein S20
VAHSKSARKRVRQNIKARLRNRRRKEGVREAVRAFQAAAAAGQPDQAQALLKEAYKRLDQVAAKGTIHKNTAARRKARLARRLAQMSRPAPA